MNTTRWSSSCGVFGHLRLLEDMVTKAGYFLNRKPRLSHSKLLQEPPIRGSYRGTLWCKEGYSNTHTLESIFSFNGQTQREISDEEGFHFTHAARDWGEEWRLGDKCQWWLESWAREDKSFMTTAVYEERGGQVKTLVKEYLTVRFS